MPPVQIFGAENESTGVIVETDDTLATLAEHLGITEAPTWEAVNVAIVRRRAREMEIPGWDTLPARDLLHVIEVTYYRLCIEAYVILSIPTYPPTADGWALIEAAYLEDLTEQGISPEDDLPRKESARAFQFNKYLATPRQVNDELIALGLHELQIPE